MDAVDKKQLWRALKRRAWIIVLAALIAGAISFGFTRLFVTPQYEAGVKMYVNNSSISVGGTSFSISASELTAAQGLVNTYIVILNSRVTLTDVIETAELDRTYEELSGMISAEAVNGTEIFEVKITSDDPAEAAKIANTIALVLPKQIGMIIEGSDVRVVDWAVEPTSSSSPSYMKNTLLGMIIGALVSVTAIVFLELMDDKIRSEDYISRVYPDIALLSVIPNVHAPKGKGYYQYYKQSYKHYYTRRTGGRGR